jgi:transposase
VQVVRYERGRAVVLKHVGSGHGREEVAALMESAQQWIDRCSGQAVLFGAPQRRTLALATTRCLGATHALAYQALRCVAGACGIDTLGDDLLVDLAIMRLVEPGSKLRAIMRLDEFFGRRHSERSVYRALRAMEGHKDALEHLAVAYARDRLRSDLSLVLYDVTTLYFESFKADELRTPGFSKDGKPQQPQLVLGLLVTREGFPLGYEIFPGNTFEGKTMLPVLRAFMARHRVEGMAVVEDAAMLSDAVLEELRAEGLHYIVAARLANSSPKLIAQVSEALRGCDQAIVRLPSKHGDMVCQFSAKRYKKDQAILQQQIAKAQALVARGEPGKRAKFIAHASKGKGYRLNEKLVERTTGLLGIKGYCTNIPREQLDDASVIARYHDLWQVEKAFRMAKSDLAVRPMYHRTRQSVHAHLAICFAALIMAKHIEMTCRASLRTVMDSLWRVTDAQLIDTVTQERYTMRSPTDLRTSQFLIALGVAY